MLRTAKELMDYVLAAEDGEIGRCRDFLFDDRHWIIRFMVADTGKWLPHRKVLISPIALGNPDAETRFFPVKLTRQQIEDSPPLDQDAPVSRQYEKRWFDYYGWPYYWEGNGSWGIAPYPTKLYLRKKEKRAKKDFAEKAAKPEESHLRSMREVTGYHIQAIDGEIGHVDDFIAEERYWTLRYLVVDTRNWLPGRKVLVAPDWVKEVDWIAGKVSVNLAKEAVKNSPEYDPSEPVNREYEVHLYDYYGRPHDWE
jgi:hypothetical protein